MFHFKKFSVSDDHSTMKVGTDSTLLGALVTPGDFKHVLDIGAGCGIISLMLAQQSQAIIDAIEIDHASSIEARENFLLSPWNDRLHLIESDFVQYVKNNDSMYDLIVCNPPFFNHGIRKINTRKAGARHQDTLNFNELCSGVSKLLHQNGTFSVIIPQSEVKDFLRNAQESQLHVNYIILIYSYPGENPVRYVITLKKSKIHQISYERLFIRQSDGQFSSEYKELLKEYLLDRFLTANVISL